MERGEEIVAESGAMVSMSPGISIETSTRGGGLLGGLARKFLTNESFFLNTFHADEPGEITLAPPLPGDVFYTDMRNQTLMVQSGSYMASSKSLSVDTQWGGRKNLLLQGGPLPDPCPWLRRPLPLQLRRDPHQGAWPRREIHSRHRPHGSLRRNSQLPGDSSRRIEVDPVQRRGPRRRAHGARESAHPVPQRRLLPILAYPSAPEARLAQAPEQQAKAADVNHRRTEPAQEIAQPLVSD